MNRNSLFFSLVCLTALLLLPPVLLHATALRASNPVPLLQNDTATAANTPITQDIRDIYGPVPIAEPPAYLLYAFVLLLFILLGIGLRLLLSYKNKKKIRGNPDPAITALRSLQRAEQELQHRGIPFFADEVSRILKSYIEQRFSIPATICTTSEFFSRLEGPSVRQEIAARHDETLGNCLHLCDKVKFSRFLPEHEAAGSLSKSVRHFIETTRSQPAEEE